MLLLLTDVEGLYDRPPSQAGAKIIGTYLKNSAIVFGEKSAQGRGGMSSKIDSAMRALDSKVQAVVVASGARPRVIADVMAGECIGTLFVECEEVEDEESNSTAAVDQAIGAKVAARQLQALTSQQRSDVLIAVAAALRKNMCEILEANKIDIENALKSKLGDSLLQRLKMTEVKIETLAVGFEQLAADCEPLGKLLRKTEIADGLMLTQVTVPIGVLLIVFESRPDSLPQICALSLRSGNGLLLKGGKEAEKSNTVLHRVIVNAVYESSGVSRDIIGLVTSREEVSELLELEEHIDLVIPRGGKALVDHVKRNTRIPVLGHADGVCHIYVDKNADIKKVVTDSPSFFTSFFTSPVFSFLTLLSIFSLSLSLQASTVIIDAKTDYPSACNACEAVLFHLDTVTDGGIHAVLMSLRSAGVSLKAGPRAITLGLFGEADAATSLSVEYGSLTCLVEVVEDMEQAIDFIHIHGSGHTECIITEDTETADLFIEKCDAACVFHNASSRFADGFRFGLGAEVGISTGRIHARGPVGVEGLLTTKWVLRSAQGDTVAAFSGEHAPRTYTHKHLDV